MAIDLLLLAAALRNSDVDAQNEAVATAINAGAQAVPALLSLWNEPGVARAQVMYALERIADPRAQRVFEAGIQDSDEQVRAYAARGLAGVGHPGALAGLLATLNDAPDPMHLDRTPSVEALAAFGIDAVAPLLDRLLDDDSMTRLHAQRALELILAARPGGQDYQALHSAWRQHGDYAWDADAERRRSAVESLRNWMAK
jgi:HEAT repeat protein